ncbi:MAG: hypothetical protein GWO24_03235, partial [Akkermansiaceae bacterium]|nr:hypothetical protein [Akkermansiaceae bacterium]
MAIEITVPRLGWSMEEGVFREWLVENGAHVQAGQSLFVLESDKAAQEVESFDAGTLFVPPEAPRAGDTVTVGQLLGYLLAEGEAAPEARSPPATPVAPGPSVAVSAEPVPSSPPGPSRRTPVTPRARRRARELGVDLASVIGSGRGGRIREQDILASARSFRTAGTGTITFVIARADATAFDALVSDVTDLRAGYSREELFSRLLESALAEYPELNAGEAIA